MSAMTVLLALLSFTARPQDLAAVQQRAEALLEEAKALYEDARQKGAAPGFVEAGFKLEDARIKYLVLAEVGAPDQQKLAAERLRAVTQLQKLVNDGKAAVLNLPAPPPAAGVEPPPGASSPAPEAPPSAVIARAPAPAAAAQKEAEKQVRDLFKEQFAKKGAAERRELAGLLLGHARKTSDDPAGRWALLREARVLAAEVCDVPLIQASCDALAVHFDVDGTALKQAALADAAKAARTSRDQEALAAAWLRLTDEMLAADGYDAAEKAVAAAQQHAKKAGDPTLTLRIAARAKEVAEAKAKHKAVKAVMEALAKNGDDPGANLEMGQFLCFVKGTWDLGLRYLLKGSDAALKAAAEKDVVFPKDGAASAEAADLWWELAAREKGTLKKAQLLSRARQLYEEALGSTSGLTRIRVEKRLSEMDRAALSPGAVDLLALIDLKQDAVLGEWSLENGALVSPSIKDYARVRIPYAPPEEYDLELVVRREGAMEALSIGLVGGGRQFLLTVDAKHYENAKLIHPVCTLLRAIDGTWDPKAVYPRPVLRGDGPVTILCSVRKDRVDVSVDGQRVLLWNAEYARVSLPPAWTVPTKQTLLLGVFECRYVIRKIVLRPVSGAGKPTR
jgi:hypothetical protein